MKVLLINLPVRQAGQPGNYYLLLETNISDQLCKKNVHRTPDGETLIVHLL